MKTVLQLAAVLVAFLLSLAVSFWAGRTVGRREAPSGKPDTVRIERWLPAPIPEPDSTQLRPKVVYLPRAVHDTTFVHDTTAFHDSVLVEVPITEKRYEAEAATCTGCTEKTNDAASGGKYMRTETTGNITFNISVPAAGQYEVVIRFSNTASNAKTQDIHVNGTKVKSQEFPVTLEGNLGGAAAAFEDMPVQVSLNAGANTFAIIKNWGHVDVDYIEVKVPGGSTRVAGFTPVAGVKFHVQVSGRNVHVSGTDGAPVAIMDMQGRVLRSGYLQGRRGLDFRVERAGSYLVRAGSAVHRVNIAR